MKKFKKISIIIPVYNEEKTVAQIVKSVSKANTFNLSKEIIIVNDGSNDNSSNIINKINHKNVIKIHLSKNHGKGYALRKGFLKSSGDIVIIQDADLEYDPHEYIKLLKPIIDGEAKVVYGSRFFTSKPHRVLYFWHSAANKLLTLLSNMLSNINLSDMETCYKVFTKDVLDKISPHLESDSFGFEPEITALVSKLSRKENFGIYEIGISYYGRTYKEGKKINWKDGVKAIYLIIKYNLFKTI